MIEKKCYTCQLVKPIESFWKHKHEIGGRKNQCIDCCKKHKKKTYEKYREKYNEQSKAYQKKNRKKVSIQQKIYRQKHIEKYRELARKYGKEKRMRNRSDPRWRLDNNVSTMVRSSLKGRKNYRSWKSLVGYSINELYHHLENLFLPGMTWENYGQWHIDHRTPQSWFKYEKAEDSEFRKCWALDNLKPMWAKLNESKGNRYSD